MLSSWRSAPGQPAPGGGLRDGRGWCSCVGAAEALLSPSASAGSALRTWPGASPSSSEGPRSKAGNCSEVSPGVDGRGDDPRGSAPTGFPLGWTDGWTGDDYGSLWLDHFERASTRTLVAGPLTRRLPHLDVGGPAPVQQRAEAIPRLTTAPR